MDEKDDTTPTEGEEQEAGAKPELGDAGKRALDAERKARRAAEKRLSELELKVKEAEDAEKTEIQRLQDLVVEWKARAEKAEADSVRHAVAAAKGLTLAQARRLVGSTKDELEADADAMAEELGIKKQDGTEESEEEKAAEEQPVYGQRPKEDLQAGASNPGDEQVDTAKLADTILKSPF